MSPALPRRRRRRRHKQVPSHDSCRGHVGGQ